MVKLRDRRVVKIFFSSPFGGMEEEREELTRKYFPQIHHACNAKGLQFVAVDMRWGITAESSENAQVINICLREIDRSDMFVGFFGQRYGWHGSDDTVLQANFDNAVGRYPWLDSVRDKSVTELEFLHGFLNNPGQLPAMLFFRDKSYDDKMRAEGQEKGDKKQVFKYSSEGELAERLMEDLKERVYANRDKSLGVHMAYKTPAEAARLMFDGIMKHLNEVLLVDLVVKSLSKREELLAQHDAFLASRRNIFVGGEKLMKQFDKQLAQDSPSPMLVTGIPGPGKSALYNPSPMLVTGGPGAGKSALLCNLVSRLKQDNNYAVVYHFSGFAEGSTDVTSVLLRVSEQFGWQLSQATGTEYKETEPDIDSQVGEASESETDRQRDLMQRLVRQMGQLAKAGKTPVLVIDGLDKVKRGKLDKAMYWLPECFPASSVVVVSTLGSDSDTVKTLTSRNYVTIHIEDMSQNNKQEMCVQTLSASGKELSPSQLDRIVQAEMTKNPLFLKITLTELISFGYFRLLDKKIDSLISSKSIEELFGKFLQRLEEDYNVEDYDGNLVEQVMCSICLSRQGLSETELNTMYSIPDHVWSPLYFAIEHVIIDQAGLLKFGFTELTDAVVEKYMNNIDKRHRHLQKLIDYFQEELIDMRLGLDSSKHRPIFELPWLLLDLGDKAGLAKCLLNYNVFVLLEKHNVYDLIRLWQQTGLSRQDTVDKLLRTFDDTLVDLYVHMEKRHLLDSCVTPGIYLEHFLRRADRFLSEFGFHEEREKTLLRTIQVLENGLQHSVVKDREEHEDNLEMMKYKLACLYCQLYHKENQGIKLHQQLLDKLEKKIADSGSPATGKQLQTLGHYYHGIGVGLVKLQQYEKVIEYSKKSLECHNRSDHRQLTDIASSHCNIGLANMHLEHFDEALKYFEECLRLYEEAHFGQLPPVVGEMLTNMALCYRKMGKLEEAEKTYLKSLKVKETALGHDHPVVAVTYINLGTLEMYRDNFEKNLEYVSEAVKIYERLGQTWDNPEYIMCLENRLAALTSLQRYQEAEQSAMQVLEWRVKDSSMDHCLPSVYREMVKYYIREGKFEDGYKMTHALLNSKHKDEFVSYIHMDWCLSNIDKKFREELPKEFTLEYAIELWPDNVSLVKYYIENHLVPAGNTEEIVRLINRLHSQSDLGASVYVYSCAWCVVDGVVQENSYQRVVLEGLKIYPDNLELLLAIAKSYRRQNEPALALQYLTKVANQETDNVPLLVFAAMTAALAQEFDVCRRYCNMVLDQTSEEETRSQVQTLLNDVNEAEKEMPSGESQGAQKETSQTTQEQSQEQKKVAS